MISEKTYSNVYFSALDWGLGHIMRSIPILEKLNYNKLYVFGKKDHFEILTENGIESEYIPGDYYSFNFDNQRSFIRYAWTNRTQIIRQIKSTNNQINQKNIKSDDLILSDNVYGFNSERCKSHIITHQTQLPIDQPIKPFAQMFLRKYLKPFDEIWIPDYEGFPNRLTGNLSKHGKHQPIKFIGPISRFNQEETKFKRDILVIPSGPQPFKREFIKLSQEVLKKNPSLQFDVLGETISENLNTAQLNTLISESRLVISRSGYTTLMDMHLLNKPCILIPTPGQAEQEYLAEYNQGKFSNINFVSERQFKETRIDMKNLPSG